MPVSGLVVTLAPPLSPSIGMPADPGNPVPSICDASSRTGHDASLHADASGSRIGACATSPDYSAVIVQIRQRPNFQAGSLQGLRLPVVLDTPDKETDKQCWCWINSLPGVHHVDVAFIHFEDEDAFDSFPCSANADRLIAAPSIGET